jgi:hypothetical protein
MKLLTQLTASRDGSLVDATDENLIHDAACAHALMMAITEIGTRGIQDADEITNRADEIMAGWGLDCGEVE